MSDEKRVTTTPPTWAIEQAREVSAKVKADARDCAEAALRLEYSGTWMVGTTADEKVEHLLRAVHHRLSTLEDDVVASIAEALAAEREKAAKEADKEAEYWRKMAESVHLGSCDVYARERLLRADTCASVAARIRAGGGK